MAHRDGNNAHRISKVERTAVLVTTAKERSVRPYGVATIFFLWLAAGALGAIGAWSFYLRRRFLRDELDDPLLEAHLPKATRDDLSYSIDPTYFALATGAFGVLVGFAGIIAVCRRSTRLFTLVLVALLLLLLAHLATGVVALVYRETIKDDIHESLKSDLLNRIDITKSSNATEIDVVQRAYACCGAESPRDWVSRTANSTCRGGDSCVNLPQSCCRYPPQSADADCADFFDVGCVDSMGQRIETLDLFILSIGAFGLAVVVILSLVFAAAYLHRIGNI